MGVGRTLSKKPDTRPVKGIRERARRLRSQKKRLIELGVSEARIAKLTSREVRRLLLRPAAIKPG